MLSFRPLLQLVGVLLFCQQGAYCAGIDNASSYQSNSSLQFEWGLSAIERMQLKGDERVLDVGCGDGRLSAEIASQVPDGLVVGIDASRSMVELASTTFGPTDYPRLLFLTGRAAQLPFHGQFDRVFSNCCLHWVQDQLAALTRIRDALTAEGRAHIVTVGPAVSNVGVQCERLAHTSRWSHLLGEYRSHKVYFTWEQYQELLDQAGLYVMWHEDATYWWRFETRSRLVEWLRPLVVLTRDLSLELQEQFLQELVDQMVKPNSEGAYLLPFSRMEMVLERGSSA